MFKGAREIYRSGFLLSLIRLSFGKAGLKKGIRRETVSLDRLQVR